MTGEFFDDTEDAEKALADLKARVAKAPVPIPGDILEKLFEIASYVSLGHTHSQCDAGYPYPDAKARFALGAYAEWRIEMMLRAEGAKK